MRTSESEHLESNVAGEELGILMNAKVNMSQQSSLMGKSLLGSSMSIKNLFFLL